MGRTGDGRRFASLGPARRIPAADAGQKPNRGQRQQGEGRDGMLAERHHDERRQQGPERLSEIAADLKQALGEPMPAAGCEPCDARSFRVKDGAADSDHRDRKQDHRIGVGEGEQRKANQREGHAGGQDPVDRPPVETHADQRLEERGRDLENQGDGPDLEECQGKLLVEDRIERRRQRLHRVVEHMRRAERGDDADGRGRIGLGARWRAVNIGRRCGQTKPSCPRRSQRPALQPVYAAKRGVDLHIFLTSATSARAP